MLWMKETDLRGNQLVNERNNKLNPLHQRYNRSMSPREMASRRGVSELQPLPVNAGKTGKFLQYQFLPLASINWVCAGILPTLLHTTWLCGQCHLNMV